MPTPLSSARAAKAASSNSGSPGGGGPRPQRARAPPAPPGKAPPPRLVLRRVELKCLLEPRSSLGGAPVHHPEGGQGRGDGPHRLRVAALETKGDRGAQVVELGVKQRHPALLWFARAQPLVDPLGAGA